MHCVWSYSRTANSSHIHPHLSAHKVWDFSSPSPPSHLVWVTQPLPGVRPVLECGQPTRVKAAFPLPAASRYQWLLSWRLGVGPLLPLHCRVLSGLVLGKVSASQHNCSEFGCAAALLRLEDCTPEVIQSSSTLDPHNLSISSKFPVPFWDVCDVRVQLRAVHLCLHADSGTLLIIICHKKLLWKGLKDLYSPPLF